VIDASVIQAHVANPVWPSRLGQLVSIQLFLFTLTSGAFGWIAAIFAPADGCPAGLTMEGGTTSSLRADPA